MEEIKYSLSTPPPLSLLAFPSSGPPHQSPRYPPLSTLVAAPTHASDAAHLPTLLAVPPFPTTAPTPRSHRGKEASRIRCEIEAEATNPVAGGGDSPTGGQGICSRTGDSRQVVDVKASTGVGSGGGDDPSMRLVRPPTVTPLCFL